MVRIVVDFSQTTIMGKRDPGLSRIAMQMSTKELSSNKGIW